MAIIVCSMYASFYKVVEKAFDILFDVFIKIQLHFYIT